MVDWDAIGGGPCDCGDVDYDIPANHMFNEESSSEMRTFNFPEDSVCVVCGKNHNSECVLITVQDTSDGRICEAVPVHIECINPKKMIFNREVGIIYIAPKGD